MALINRFHALYAVAGETGLKKKDLMTAGSREKQRLRLPGGTLRMIGESIERELETVERELAVYREKIAGIVRESEEAPCIMSIPGVGPSLTAAFTAYVGDTERYGRIRRGGCRAPRSVIVQSAWAVSRSRGEGWLKTKFAALSGRMSKTKSIKTGAECQTAKRFGLEFCLRQNSTT